MSTDHETTRIVRSWLEDGATHLPDSVLGTVLAELPTTPQRRATWWPARRASSMNRMLGFGLLAASVVAVVLIGLQIFAVPNRFGAPGLGPSANPDPTNLPDSGALAPGAYRINAGPFTPLDLVFAVPSGWQAGDLAVIVKNPGQPTEVGLAPDLVTHVYADACDPDSALNPIGPTADDLVEALLAQGNVDVTGQSDVILDGHPAQRLDLAHPASLDAATCTDAGRIRIWADELETFYLELAADRTASVYVADVNGQRIVVTTETGPDATQEDIVQRDDIVHAMRIGP